MDTTDAEIERLLDGHDPAIAELTRNLCARIRALLPDAVVTVDGGDIGFGTAPGYRGLVFTVSPHTAHVTLGVDHGAGLPDPAGLLTGSGKVHRHVKLRGTADAERPELHELLAARLARQT